MSIDLNLKNLILSRWYMDAENIKYYKKSIIVWYELYQIWKNLMDYFKCKSDITVETLFISLSLIVFHSLCHAIQIKQDMIH